VSRYVRRKSLAPRRPSVRRPASYRPETPFAPSESMDDEWLDEEQEFDGEGAGQHREDAMPEPDEEDEPQEVTQDSGPLANDPLGAEIARLAHKEHVLLERNRKSLDGQARDRTKRRRVRVERAAAVRTSGGKQ